MNFRGSEFDRGTISSEMRKSINIETSAIRALSRTNPLISIYHIIGQWGLIIGAMVLSQHFWRYPLVYVVAVAFIAARQHALLILMHEGAHYRLFANKRLNDWTAEILLSWPLFIELRSYRRNHLAHHQFVNTSRDPDWARKSNDPNWTFPKRQWDVSILLLRDLSGLGALTLIKLFRSLSQREPALPKSLAIAKIVFYAMAVGVIFYAGLVRWVFLYWFVPFSTWLIVIMHVRSIAEHFGIENRNGIFNEVRTTRAGWLARLFVAPENVNYHLEHHLFPSVPCYRLPQLHSLLWSTAEFREGAHITAGYLRMLKECTMPRSASRQKLLPADSVPKAASAAEAKV